ncbi:MAG: hypothetical protein IZT59_10870 [Verrucomicrobia bacterium]|jgi:aconitase A|nr:hypothetical protein [Verrucomicrobiota bacterium]|tara:strand:- start:14307 stop:14543 length:237 start_codon:yes stop_codon:yes gene_type:complete
MDTIRTFTTGSGTEGKFHSLPALAENGFPNLSKLPVSIRIALQDFTGVPLKVRLDTPAEADYYNAGGILPYVLDQILA